MEGSKLNKVLRIIQGEYNGSVLEKGFTFKDFIYVIVDHENHFTGHVYKSEFDAVKYIMEQLEEFDYCFTYYQEVLR